MKNINYMLFALGILFFSPHTAFCDENSVNREGGWTGGGGDGVASEFVSLARQNISIVEANAATIVTTETSFHIDDYRKAIQSTQVETTDDILKVKDLEKDAINYSGKGLIRLNRNRWFKLSPEQKRILVTHEYLGIMQIKDENYQFSDSLVGFSGFRYSCAFDLGDLGGGAFKTRPATFGDYSDDTRSRTKIEFPVRQKNKNNLKQVASFQLDFIRHRITDLQIDYFIKLVAYNQRGLVLSSSKTVLGQHPGSHVRLELEGTNTSMIIINCSLDDGSPLFRKF